MWSRSRRAHGRRAQLVRARGPRAARGREGRRRQGRRGRRWRRRGREKAARGPEQAAQKSCRSTTGTMIINRDRLCKRGFLTHRLPSRDWTSAFAIKMFDEAIAITHRETLATRTDDSLYWFATPFTAACSLRRLGHLTQMDSRRRSCRRISCCR